MLAAAPLSSQTPRMSFFITSQGPGNGAALGGLEGADAHCDSLARAAGSTGLVWHAYLSGRDRSGRTVNARDRIGAGPWHNAKGVQVAASVDDLQRVEGIGEARARNVREGLSRLAESSILERYV